MIQMLKMLERFPIGDASQGYGFGELMTVNVMVEAMRLAFADRSIWMGDSDFVHVPARGLLHTQYVNDRSALVNPLSRITPNPQPGDPRQQHDAGDDLHAGRQAAGRVRLAGRLHDHQLGAERREGTVIGLPRPRR